VFGLCYYAALPRRPHKALHPVRPFVRPSVCASRAYDLLEIGKLYRNFKFHEDMTSDRNNWESKFEVKDQDH